MNREEFLELQKYVSMCDPDRPLWGEADPLYEPLDRGEPVRGSYGLSCVDELAQTILLRDEEKMGPTCQLFTGFLGTGKTTELRRLKERLENDRSTVTKVIYVDFGDYIDYYTPISITDVLRTLAFAFDREATAEEAVKAGKDPYNVEEVGYLRRFYDFVARLDPEIKEIGFEVYGAKLMAEIKDNPRFRDRVENALKLRFQAFAADAEDMMKQAITRLRRATAATRFVVIADGLEKLMYLRDDDRKQVEAAVETVFVTHASWLRLPCHVIYTFPFWLRFSAPTLGTLYHREPRVLPMVKILDREGKPHQEGIDKLVRLIGRRVKPLERVFGLSLEKTLHTLILASGGYPRDLLRMVREVLLSANGLPVTDKGCEQIVDRLAQTYARVIRSSEIDILVEVARTHDLPAGDDGRIAEFSRMFGRHLVLTYMNGEEWYDIHPLVRRARSVRDRV